MGVLGTWGDGGALLAAALRWRVAINVVSCRPGQPVLETPIAPPGVDAQQLRASFDIVHIPEWHYIAAQPIVSGAGAAGTEAAQEGTTAGGTTTLEKGVFGGGSGGELLEDSDFSVNTILKQLESIQQGSPKNIVILGTRHCSFLHQQIIELLSFALVLSDNHIFTSGATGTHAAAIRGALRAGNQELLTVILPQTIQRQPQEIRDLLGQARAPLPPSPNTHRARCPRHRTAARALSRAASTARRSTA